MKGASVVEVYAGLRLSEALKDNLTSYSSFREGELLSQVVRPLKDRFSRYGV